jgi:hypothetical protein
MTSIEVGGARDFMDRIYLFVSPEEYPEVKASGACWDDASKSWYIDEGMEPARFSRWLEEEEQDNAPLGIVSLQLIQPRRQFCLPFHTDLGENRLDLCTDGPDADVAMLRDEFRRLSLGKIQCNVRFSGGQTVRRIQDRDPASVTGSGPAAHDQHARCRTEAIERAMFGRQREHIEHDGRRIIIRATNDDGAQQRGSGS